MIGPASYSPQYDYVSRRCASAVIGPPSSGQQPINSPGPADYVIRESHTSPAFSFSGPGLKPWRGWLYANV